MNFIGKIFVVFIFIMSIIFMTLAAVVYATHKNWEDQAKAAQGDLQSAQQKRIQLENEFNRIKSELEAQKDASLQQVRKLESERDVLVGRNNNLQKAVEDSDLEQERLTALANATQKSVNDTTAENTQLRGDIRLSLERTDEAFNSALAATDKLHNVQRELEVAAETRQGLLKDVGRMTAVMRANDVDPQTQLDQVTPRIDGAVQAVARRGSQVLIQVSIGEDDGLRRGHIVEVFRGTKYLGRVEILKTEPDRAIGRVDPRYQEGRIQEKDRVATRLKLG